jgi:cytochrome c oxidase subunit 3
MARAHTMTARAEVLPVRETRDDFGGGGPVAIPAPPVSNGLLAVVLLLGAEVMLFTGLIGAFVLFRTSAAAWPPPGQPMLPLGVTLANTAVLVASCATMFRAYAAVRRGDQAGLRVGLAATAALGAAFLLVQGYEWLGLIRHGLTLSSSTYGATFYTLIGLHAAHVAAAVVWLLVVLGAAFLGRYSTARHVGVQVCAVYWYFVCALWVVLFGLVYVA